MFPILAYACVLGLVAMSAPSAQATLFEYDLYNHPSGSAGPPYYGLRLDETGQVHTFGFEDGSGNSTVNMVFDTTTGIATITGSAVHQAPGNPSSGEIWSIAASLQLDTSPYANMAALDNALQNPGSGFGPLIFDSVSLSLSLLNAADPTNGYGGATDWVGKPNGNGDEFLLQWNHRTNQDVLTGNGWWIPATGDQGGGAHDFLFVARPGEPIPEPATTALIGAGLVALSARRKRRR